MKISKIQITKAFAFIVAAIIVGGLFGSFIAAGIGGIGMAMAAPGTVDYDNLIKEAREQLAGKHDEMRSLIDAAEAESRDFTDDEKSQFDKLDGEAKNIEERIARLEKAENLNAGQAGRKKQKNEDEERQEEQRKVNEAFTAYMRSGFRGMSAEQREIVENRALSTGTDSEGGYTVPEGFSEQLEKAMKAFGGIMGIARMRPTATGNNIQWPTVNDTDNEGEILGENTDAGSSTDPVFGSITLKAFTYSSKPVLIPNQLLRDNAVNLNQEIPAMLGERIFRAFNRHATVGDGNNEPEGVTVGGSQAKEIAVDAISYDDIVDLEHSVDPSYRDGAVFMFHDNTLKHLRKLKNNNDELIFQESMRQGVPSTINGYPFVINNHMPEVGAGKKSVVFGNFNKYLVRQVQGASVLRLEERYAEKNQTGFLLFMRMDGRILDAGTNPLKYLQHATA